MGHEMQQLDRAGARLKLTVDPEGSGDTDAMFVLMIHRYSSISRSTGRGLTGTK